MIHSGRVKNLSLVEVIVYLGGVPIAVPGDEEVLAIGLVADVGVGCLGTICCCLILRRRPSSLPRVPSITGREELVQIKEVKSRRTYT